MKSMGKISDQIDMRLKFPINRAGVSEIVKY